MCTRRWVVVLALWLAGWSGSLLAQSAPTGESSARWEVQAGPSYMDNRPATAVFVERIGSTRQLGQSFSWASDVSLGYLTGRSTPDRYRMLRPGLSDSVVLGAVGARVRLADPESVWSHVFFSFQVAAHTGRTQALSSVYEFVSTAGWTSHRFSLQVRHISNGSLHEPNRGETMLLVGWAF